jgi:hypothetical protein
VKITLAREWTDANGKSHKPDTTLTVPELTGRELILVGAARAADTEKETSK